MVVRGLRISHHLLFHIKSLVKEQTLEYSISDIYDAKSFECNQLKADKILAQKFQGDELQRRMMVQKGFSTDPVGIIKIKLK